jgi:hypothetical protein
MNDIMDKLDKLGISPGPLSERTEALIHKWAEQAVEIAELKSQLNHLQQVHSSCPPRLVPRYDSYPHRGGN